MMSTITVSDEASLASTAATVKKQADELKESISSIKSDLGDAADFDGLPISAAADTVAKNLEVACEDLVTASTNITNLASDILGYDVNDYEGNIDKADQEKADSIYKDLVSKYGEEKAKTLMAVWTFLKGKGLSDEAAAGVMGNMQQESNFSTTAVGDGGTSYGLIQWHAGRKDNLYNYCKQHGYDVNSLEGQLNFLWEESLDPNSSYGKRLTERGFYNASSASDAAVIFHDVVEGSADSADAVRRVRGGNAENWYSTFTGLGSKNSYNNTKAVSSSSNWNSLSGNSSSGSYSSTGAYSSSSNGSNGSSGSKKSSSSKDKDTDTTPDDKKEEDTTVVTPIEIIEVTTTTLPTTIEQFTKNYDEMAEMNYLYGSNDTKVIDLVNQVDMDYTKGNIGAVEAKLRELGYTDQEILAIMPNREKVLDAVMSGYKKQVVTQEAVKLATADGIKDFKSSYKPGSKDELFVPCNDEKTIKAKEKLDTAIDQYVAKGNEAKTALDTVSNNKKAMEELEKSTKKEFGSDTSKWTESTAKKYNAAIEKYNNSVKDAEAKIKTYEAAKATYDSALSDFNKARDSYVKTIMDEKSNITSTGDSSGSSDVTNVNDNNNNSSPIEVDKTTMKTTDEGINT